MFSTVSLSSRAVVTSKIFNIPPCNQFTVSFYYYVENSEAVVQRCSVKKVFLEISQNSQENTCACTLLKKRLWHRCFPVNFAKFLRTPFIIEHLWCGCFCKLMLQFGLS